MLHELLEGNKKFAEEDFKRLGLKALVEGQDPPTVWIGCCDSRVPPELIAKAGFGELFVHRNIANIVPEEDTCVGALLEYAVNHLCSREIIVCGHYDCGGIRALDGDVEGEGMLSWLENAAQVQDAGDGLDGDERHRARVDANVKLQLKHLLAYECVKKAVDAGRVKLVGLVYDIETGKLKEV